MSSSSNLGNPPVAHLQIVLFSRSIDTCFWMYTVLSSSLTWLSNGSCMPDETNCSFFTGQLGSFGPGGIRPCMNNIVLAKLRPGQVRK